MTADLDRTLAGHLVAAVIEVLLVDAGYQVVPTGIECSVREVRSVPPAVYRELAHPRPRTAPDFFVLDVDARQAWLTEVKYRQYLHPKLHAEDFPPIQRDWSPFVLALAMGDPPEAWGGTVRHPRAFEVGPDTVVDDRLLRGAGRRIQDVFPRLASRWSDETIVQAQDAVLRSAARAPLPGPPGAAAPAARPGRPEP